jgi:DNA-binding transcriptional LysR family regulator
MQIESLKMFCDVVETGSFSNAARLNRVTQSAVSQQVRALETRYTQKLLSRSARSAVPTPAGARLYRAAKDIIGAFAGLESAMREESNQVAGEVAVATIYSVGLHELSPYLKAILRRYPKINVRLCYRRSDQVFDDILNDRADLGLVAYPSPRPGVRVLPFRSDELVLVCSREHPLMVRRQVRLADLEGMRFVAFERDIPTGRAVDKLLKGAGVKVQTALELDNVETIKRAVELGLGVSILPKASVQTEELAGTLLARTLADGTFTRPIGVVVRKGRYLGKAADAVVEVLTKAK